MTSLTQEADEEDFDEEEPGEEVNEDMDLDVNNLRT